MTPRTARQRDDGFTLIELLVVITILGILSAVVVFSLGGLGNKKTESESADIAAVRTAEEAYCAKNGSYGTLSELTASPRNFLASIPTSTSIVLTDGSCGSESDKSGFVVGSPSSSPSDTTGELVLAASDTAPAFSFLSSSAPDPVHFTFGSSGPLATTANNSGSAAVLFTSADEASIDATIPAGDAALNPASAGCSGTCAGIGSTKRLYATGHLVVFQCSSGGSTLEPAAGAPKCAAPPGGYVPTPTTTPAEAVNALAAHPTGFGKYVLALPCPTAAEPCSADHPPAEGSPTDPYGVAAYEALTSTATGGGGLSSTDYDALVTSGQIVFGADDDATQKLVTSGAAQIALLPESFVKAPGDDPTHPLIDTDQWTEVSEALVGHPIDHYAVVLDHGTSARQNVGRTFLNYLDSGAGQAVLVQFGYDRVASYAPIPPIAGS